MDTEQGEDAKADSRDLYGMPTAPVYLSRGLEIRPPFRDAGEGIDHCTGTVAPVQYLRLRGHLTVTVTPLRRGYIHCDRFPSTAVTLT